MRYSHPYQLKPITAQLQKLSFDPSLLGILGWLIILADLFAFLGPSLFALPIGPYQLLPYRAGLLLVFFVAATSVMRGTPLQIETFRPVGLPLTMFGLWAAYSIASICWADSTIDCLRYNGLLVTGLLFVILNVWLLKSLDALFFSWVIMLVPCLIIGWWNLLTGQHLSLQAEGLELASNPLLKFAPNSVYINVNDYATYLSLSMSILLSGIKNLKSTFLKTIIIILFVNCLVQLFSTGSRANILAICAVFLIWFVTNFKWRASVVLIASLCVLIAGAAFFSGNQWIMIVGHGFGDKGDIFDFAGTGSSGIRFNLIKNVLIILQQQAFLGVGAGNAEYHLLWDGVYSTGGIYNVHNWWFEILLNYGVLVFVPYCLMIGSMLIVVTRHFFRRMHEEHRLHRDAVFFSLLAFLPASGSSSSIMALMPQWILMAYMLCYFRETDMRIVVTHLLSKAS